MSNPPPNYSTGSDPYKPPPPPDYSSPHQPNSSHHQPQPPRPEGYGNGYEKFDPRPKYNDVWATILFLIHLAGFIAISILYLPKLFQAFQTGQSPGVAVVHVGLNGTVTNSTTIQQSNAGNAAVLQTRWAHVLGVLGVVLVLGFVMALLYLWLAQQFARKFIQGSLIASIVLYIGITVYLLIRGVWLPAIFTGLFAILYAIAAVTWVDRIPFATVMLETVTSIMRKYKGTVLTAFVGLIVVSLWTIFFSFTLMGVVLNYSKDAQIICRRRGLDAREVCTLKMSGVAYVVFVFCLFSFYWTIQVIKNVVHVTVCGVFGAFYFLQNTPHEQTSPTIGAAKRALTYSFGSIAFGSLLVAIIRTVRAIMEMLARQDDGILAFIGCLAACFLSCIESLLTYFNVYAYAMVALYGKPFLQAGRDVMVMFSERGIEAIVNDNLIGNVLEMGILTVGFLNGLLTYLYLILVVPDIGKNSTLVFIVVLVAFLVSIAFMNMAAQVIESGCVTIYVALGEDPAVLARLNPELFARIRETWPEVVVGVPRS